MPLADSNARLAAARRLTRRQHRRETGLLLAEGLPAVRSALTRPGAVREVFVTAQARRRHADLLAGLPSGVRVDVISERAAAALSETVNPQGIIAVCARVDVALDAVFGAQPRLIAALIEPNDPGNAGTIIRTADAAGADAVVVVGGVDVYNGKAVRASAGSIFHLDVALDASAEELLTAARVAGQQILATTGRGAQGLEQLLADGSLTRPTLWLFGTEASGLPDELLHAADSTVRVPIAGRAESLNLAAAAAVCLYASAWAQRGPSAP